MDADFDIKKSADFNYTMICSYCKLPKEEGDFRKNRRKCRSCEKEDGKKYYHKHKDKRKKWAQENKKRMKELQSNWYQKNKDKRNQKEREKSKNDPSFRLYKNCRRRICYLINKQDTTKSYIGTKFSVIKKWFEFCFDEKMNWDNYGTYWHCDHVIAANNFDLTDPKHIYLCFNWKNLSPLSEEDNMNKKDKVLMEQIDKHCDKLKQFIEENEIQTDFDDYMNKYKEHLDTLDCKTPCCGKPLKA